MTLLRFSILVVAVSGLIYELLIGTVASYLLGSYVLQFSLVVGFFLFSTGVGSFASRYVKENLLTVFIAAELTLALVGGFSSLALVWAYVLVPWFTPCMMVVIFLCGALVGLELPIMVRILRLRSDLRASVSDAMALDYIGALIACLLFPLLLLPHLGVSRTAIVAGMANAATACLLLLRPPFPVTMRRPLWGAAIFVTVALSAGLATGGRLADRAEDRLYRDEILLKESSRYQRIVVTRWKDTVSLFLDRNLQFSSLEEETYHDGLVHPGMSLVGNPRRVLILGGGDGLALREVLKYPEVRKVDLVDIDPAMTNLFRTHPLLRSLNGGSLDHPKVEIHNEDAAKFLDRTKESWDVILADFPDPFNESLAKLFSRGFFLRAGSRVSENGVYVTSVVPPRTFPVSHSCILNTMKNALEGGGGRPFRVVPYQRDVFAFGPVAYIMASRTPFRPEDIRVDIPTGTISGGVGGWFSPSPERLPADTPINRLDRPVLSRLADIEKRGGDHRRR